MESNNRFEDLEQVASWIAYVIIAILVIGLFVEILK